MSEGDMVCTDHYFIGWKDSVTEEIYQPGDTFEIAADVTLLATWAENPTYTVSYDANGGEGGPNDNTAYQTGETINIIFARQNVLIQHLWIHS